jgi:hypothetical protein
LPPLSSGGALVVPPWLRFHIPLINGQADFPHPALGQDFTLSRATPSAASEHLLELIGFPISRSFTTYCVCLELRSLPSTGVTQLPRYYEPLRHPRAPSLSLTGICTHWKNAAFSRRTPEADVPARREMGRCRKGLSYPSRTCDLTPPALGRARREGSRCVVEGG